MGFIMNLKRTGAALLMASSLAWAPGCSDDKDTKPSSDWNISPGEGLPTEFAPALEGAGPIDFHVKPYLQAPSSSSMAVMVELKSSDLKAEVHIRRAGSALAHRVVPMESASSDGLVRIANIDALSSNAYYEYQIVVGDAKTVAARLVSDRYFFRTWPEAGDNVTKTNVIAISDTQYNHGSNINILRNIVEDGIMGHECELDNPLTCVEALSGIFIAGDIVEVGSIRKQWRDEFFSRMEAISPYVPIVASTGNHDYYLDGKLQFFREYFEGPRNGTEGQEDRWYSLDLNGVRFFVLDSSPGAKSVGFYEQPVKDAQYNWLQDTLAQTDARMSLGVFHHGCLSELWLMGESVGSCDFVFEFEKWSAEKNRLSAHLFGHTHGYSRGQSRDVHHLWLNSASASGDLEPVDQEKHYDSQMHDYDTFHVSRSEYGYSVLRFDFSGTPSMTIERRQGGHTAGVEYPVVDTNTFFVGDAPAAPSIGDIEGSGASTELVVDTDLDDLFEIHWQFAHTEAFDGDVFDVWGNYTRRENFFYERGSADGDRLTGYAPIDFQEGVDIRRLEPWPLISSGSVLAGDYDQWRRWNKGGELISAADSSVNDPWPGSGPATLELEPGDTVYVRARVRDSALNWSSWSAAKSVTF